MRFLTLPIAALLLTACASNHPATPQPVSDNPYTQAYTSQAKVAAKAEAGPPQIFRGKDKQADYQRQLEKGYDVLGYSSFEAADVAPAKLTEQAVKVNADVALVYTAVANRTMVSVRPDAAKAATGTQAANTDEAPGTGRLYNYFATYWTKLPAPILGVHVQGTAQAQNGETGLVVLAVIEGSPAAAELRKDDTLLRLGDARLDQPEALMQTARRYAGQSVEVVFERQGEILSRSLTLASRP